MATSSEHSWAGFDLGGTKMLAAVFDEELQQLAQKRRRTRGEEGAEAGMRRIVRTIGDALDRAGLATDDLLGLGIGAPGPLDLARGVILETPNLGWQEVPLQAELERELGCPTVVLNDVDAGVYGEYVAGAARGARCAIGVFPGTGIGGGCVYEGAILRGRTASCFEIGHLEVQPDGPLCGCGQRGCLEALASRLAVAAAAATAARRGDAPHLLEHVGTDLSTIRSQALAASIAAGDRAVDEIVRHAAQRIGRAVAGVVNLLAPDVILLGGGLVEALPELFRDEVAAAAEGRVMPPYRGTFRVVTAELGDDAAIVGAAAWAQKTLSGLDDS